MKNVFFKTMVIGFASMMASEVAFADCLRYGDSVYIADKWQAGKKYLVAEPSGGVYFNRNAAGPWEHFKIVNSEKPRVKGNVFHGDKISLLTVHDKYLTATSNTNVGANAATTEDGATWTIEQNYSNANPNKCIGLTSNGSPATPQFVLKSKFGNYLKPNGTGGTTLGTKTNMVLVSSGHHQSQFKIPQQAKVNFLGNCNEKTVSSQFGPLDVCTFKTNEMMVVDLRGVTGNAYFIELREFKPQIWAGQPSMPYSGPQRSLYKGWVCSNCSIPEYVNVSEYSKGFSDLFHETTLSPNPPALSASTDQDGTIYMLTVASGPQWTSTHLFFDVEN